MDTKYMKLALELAKKGCGWTAPNPLVGAVIVKNDEIIGTGWHQSYGQSHAERNALADCKESTKGATLYVTLEPCCHYGKTPPCTEAILESGITTVVIGSHDPNPLVAGKGITILREHGMKVVEGILQSECEKLNQVFFHFIHTGRPFVVMKYAMTMDGKIATCTGASKWITGEESRHQVQLDRHRYSAIMVGSGTVLADDPLLTCRLEHGKNPIRIICDTQLRTPFNSQIVKTASQIPTLIATACTDEEKLHLFRQSGCKLLIIPTKDKHLDLNVLMSELGKLKIDSILLEGGGILNWSALESHIVQKIQCYIAPKLFGGFDAKSPISGRGVPTPNEAYMLTNTTITQIGNDYLLESEVKFPCLQESLKK
ncbi:MAG: bifunctional diaminohydroxyphosphoribosylaminopyrimidine deaminase/5-amino-6-(5-phosphoribosylamino)uracil reductase RibD [Lachnospiraceae bacterium]